MEERKQDFYPVQLLDSSYRSVQYTENLRQTRAQLINSRRARLMVNQVFEEAKVTNPNSTSNEISLDRAVSELRTHAHTLSGSSSSSILLDTLNKVLVITKSGISMQYLINERIPDLIISILDRQKDLLIKQRLVEVLDLVSCSPLEEHTAKLAEIGVIEKLLPLCTENCPELQEVAIMTLANMAISGDKYILPMLQKGVMKNLQAVLNMAKVALPVYAATMLLLGELTNFSKGLPTSDVTNFMGYVLEAIEMENEDAVAGALRFISRITEYSDSEKVFAVLCRKDQLSKILSHIYSPKKTVHSPAAISAGNLCIRSEKCAEFYYRNGVLEAVSFIASFKEPSNKVNACHVIWGMLEGLKRFAAEFWDSGAAPIVFSSLEDKRMEVVRAAANVLSYAIEKTDPGMVLEIFKTGTLDRYLALLLQGDDVVTARVSSTLCKVLEEIEHNDLVKRLQKVLGGEKIQKLLLGPMQNSVNELLVCLMEESEENSESQYMDLHDAEKLKSDMMNEEIQRLSQDVGKGAFSLESFSLPF